MIIYTNYWLSLLFFAVELGVSDLSIHISDVSKYHNLIPFIFNWIFAYDMAETSFLIKLQIFDENHSNFSDAFHENFYKKSFLAEQEKSPKWASKILKGLKNRHKQQREQMRGRKKLTESRETFIILWTHDFSSFFLPLAFYCKLTACCFFFTDCMFFKSDSFLPLNFLRRKFKHFSWSAYCHKVEL
jgi:hypothetical protein